MKKCAEMGIFGLMVPEEYGGTNLGTVHVDIRPGCSFKLNGLTLSLGIFASCLAGEEIARVHAGVSMIIGAHNNLAIHVIESNGTTEQKEKFLPDLVNADKGSSYLRVYYYKNAISGTITTYYKIVI